MFAERLKEQRKKHGDTQQSLGEKLGYSKFAIAVWEQGKATPNYKTLVEICRMYDVSADYLLGIIDIERTQPKAMDDREQVIANLKAYINNL